MHGVTAPLPFMTAYIASSLRVWSLGSKPAFPRFPLVHSRVAI